MKWNRQFKYPKRKHSIVSGKRNYEVNNSKLPSVTTILEATQSQHKRDSLKKWRKKVGEKEAQRILVESSKRGTDMHKYLEEYLIGQANLELLESNEEAKQMAQNIIDNGLKNLNELWGAEVTVHFPNSYAGTADACGIYNGNESILDFKQSNNPKKREWCEDYFFQVAAYAMAHNKVYNTNITQGVILICTPLPNIEFQEFIINGNDFLTYQEKFLKKVEEYNNIIL